MEPTRLECPWDAGLQIKEHVIRAVVEMIGGTRAVTSMRTKGLDLVEAVRVEVVQVTAVVHDRGRFIKGLPASAFRLLENDVAAEDHALLVGGLAAGAGRRRGRQRKHDAPRCRS